MGTDDWPPFRIRTEWGFVGLDLDVINEVARRMEINVLALRFPWGRSLKSMEAGTIDLMTGLAYRAERAQYIAYTETPYFQCSTVFYTQKGRARDLSEYEDLRQMSVGYVLHSAYFEQFDTDETLSKMGVAEEISLIGMLKNNRLDAIIGTDCQLDYFIKSEGLDEVIEKADFRPGNAVGLYIGISRKSPWAARIDEFNRVIRELLDEGFVANAAHEYYGKLAVQ
ncbi:ABC transporter substrate-binding protein [Roseibium aquae]|uniref:ABC transporter substrate-binding protein n=1 Tax=Roseibium aquae TaxID=1323746 RepID=A0A916X151_9HYPH|nr:transporter substrate-binding domain-containing protein [Roseibium aquae]GGB50221.1 ABC transporter substrate-binding protein [Roseibium aquae]